MNMSERRLTIMCGDNVVTNFPPYVIVQKSRPWRNEYSRFISFAEGQVGVA